MSFRAISTAPVPGNYEANFSPRDKGKFVVSACCQVAYSPHDTVKGSLLRRRVIKWPTLHMIQWREVCCVSVLSSGLLSTWYSEGKFAASVCYQVAYSPHDTVKGSLLRRRVIKWPTLHMIQWREVCCVSVLSSGLLSTWYSEGKFAASVCYQVAYSPHDTVKGSLLRQCVIKWPTLHMIQWREVCCISVLSSGLLSTWYSEGKFAASVCYQVAYSPHDTVKGSLLLQCVIKWPTLHMIQWREVCCVGVLGSGLLSMR